MKEPGTLDLSAMSFPYQDKIWKWTREVLHTEREKKLTSVMESI